MPVPSSATETLKVGTMAPKVTCSIWLFVMVTLQVAASAQVLQPLKTEPIAGVAVSVTTVPDW